MELLILGAGGIGGYLTSRMQQAGFSPRLLVRPNRADQLRQTGLRLTSPLGDWAGMPIIESDPSALPKADFIFLTCKSYDLETALDAIAAAVNEKTIIVPFLNGVRHIEIIKARLPHAIVWGGVAHLGVRVEPDGSICHFNDLNKFLIGPVDVSSSDERARVLVERLAEGPTEFTYKENIQQDMWDKLVFLSALAGMTCLMRADIGTILATNQGEDLILQLLDEASCIAEAEGRTTTVDAMKAYQAQLLDRSSRSTASMLRDMINGKQTEADSILGDMSERAARHALRVPLLRTCLSHLQAYELAREPI